jgi:hypothetical protein
MSALARCCRKHQQTPNVRYVGSAGLKGFTPKVCNSLKPDHSCILVFQFSATPPRMKTARHHQLAEVGPTSKNPPRVIQSGRVWQNFRRWMPRSGPDKFFPEVTAAEKFGISVKWVGRG